MKENLIGVAVGIVAALIGVGVYAAFVPLLSGSETPPPLGPVLTTTSAPGGQETAVADDLPVVTATIAPPRQTTTSIDETAARDEAVRLATERGLLEFPADISADDAYLRALLGCGTEPEPGTFDAILAEVYTDVCEPLK